MEVMKAVVVLKCVNITVVCQILRVSQAARLIILIKGVQTKW